MKVRLCEIFWVTCSLNCHNATQHWHWWLWELKMIQLCVNLETLQRKSCSGVPGKFLRSVQFSAFTQTNTQSAHCLSAGVNMHSPIHKNTRENKLLHQADRCCSRSTLSFIIIKSVGLINSRQITDVRDSEDWSQAEALVVWHVFKIRCYIHTCFYFECRESHVSSFSLSFYGRWRCFFYPFGEFQSETEIWNRNH